LYIPAIICLISIFEQLEKMPLPILLKKDAILESVLEIRFDTKELPEVIIGYLINNDAWKGYLRGRTPIADLPATIRWSQPDLRYQPILELRDQTGHKSIKIGERVISFHKLKPYSGWNQFSHDLSEVTKHLFSKLEDIQIERLGLRYINSLNKQDHGIQHPSELNIKVTIQDHEINEHFNFNYSHQHDEDFISLARIATPDFVEGNLPDGSTVYVDIDIFTPSDFRTNDQQRVLDWVENAHTIEKEIFFRLIPQNKLQPIVEK
jgi:uncharacterized protein (TIGR04255 family)